MNSRDRPDAKLEESVSIARARGGAGIDEKAEGELHNAGMQA